MNITLTCPGFSVHGGIRIVLEWANRLSEDNIVSVLSPDRKRPTWFKLKPEVQIITRLQKCDILIICSPHHIELQESKHAKKVFIFLQMMEHLFRPLDKKWLTKCKQFYASNHPMILGSNWNYVWCKEKFGRTAPTYYVGNGVNLDDFPIRQSEKCNIVLVEGWQSSNPVKDTDHIGPKVAARLKEDGYQIIAYSALPLKTMPHVPDWYMQKPSLEQMNAAYNNATILIKATKYDARALAPMEAMTKACVTARAIILGDDDLIHNVTALRCEYDEEQLYQTAKKLLTDHQLRNELSVNCLRYVQEFSWDLYMDKIRKILSGNPDLDSIL